MPEFNSTLYIPRDQEEQLFLKVLRESYYLDLYGPTGLGKTTFLTWIVETRNRENYLVSYVDLAISQEFYTSIAEQLYDYQRLAQDPFLAFKEEFYGKPKGHQLTEDEITKFHHGLQDLLDSGNGVVLIFDNTEASVPPIWQRFEEKILSAQPQLVLITAGQKPLTLKTPLLRNRLKSVYLSYFTAREVREQLHKLAKTNTLQIADEEEVVSKLLKLTHGHPLSVETLLTLWSDHFKQPINAQTVAKNWATGVKRLMQDVVEEKLAQWQLDRKYPAPLAIVQHLAPLRDLNNKDFYYVLARFFQFFADHPPFWADKLIPDLSQKIHLAHWSSGVGSKWHPIVRNVLLEHLRINAPAELHKVHQALAELYGHEVSGKEGSLLVTKLIEQFYHIAADLAVDSQEDVTEALCEKLQTYLKNRFVEADLLTVTDKQWLRDHLGPQLAKDAELGSIINMPALLKVIDDFIDPPPPPAVKPTELLDDFVGRAEELDLFRELLAPTSPTRILAFYTEGQGGVGKTKLLSKLQQRCQESQNLLYNRELIDFFHPESKSRIGVIEQLATYLQLTDTLRHVEIARHTRNIAEREKLEDELLGKFFQEYYQFAKTCHDERRQLLVFFFDSYEYVQRVEEELKKAIPTIFSEWLEKQLFSPMVAAPNVRLLIAGRHPPLSLVDNPLVSLPRLSPFSPEVTRLFLQRRNLLPGHSLDDLASPAVIEAFHSLCRGQPVFLALLSDWISTAPISLQQFYDDIVTNTGQDISSQVTSTQTAYFERSLIHHIHQFLGTSELAVTYLAVAWRRTTPAILSWLTGESLPHCEKTVNLFKEKWGTSFIKIKPNDVILLHDEMARLLNEYFWIDNRHAYENSLQRLVEYYDKQLLGNTATLSEADREAYTLELIGYAFQADFANGLVRFTDEFDLAMEDGRYDYSESLLQEAERALHQRQGDIPFGNTLEFLQIPLRRINFAMDTGKAVSENVCEAVLTEYQDDRRWQESNIQGHFWLSRGRILASVKDPNYESVIAAFKQATRIFFDTGEDQWGNLTMNRIGESYFQQGHFSAAETWLLRSQRGFNTLLGQFPEGGHQLDKKRALRHRQILQGVQKTLGNLAGVYSYTGRFYWAFICAYRELQIVRSLERNSKELVHSLNTLAQMSALIGQPVAARELLDEALRHLEHLKVPLQFGEAKLNLFLLEFRQRALTYPLEYYLADEVGNLLDLSANVTILQKSLDEAIPSLPGTLPQLAQAYLAQAELQLVRGEFSLAEQSLEKGWQCAKNSNFLYWQVTALKDLVRLYYVWQAAPVAPDRSRKRNDYKEELERFFKTPLSNLPTEFQPLARVARTYPEVLAKYEMVLGHLEFDQAVTMLRREDKRLEVAISFLNKAVIHYIAAAKELRQDFKKLYHLALSMFRKRLAFFIELACQQGLEKRLEKRLDVLTANWGEGEEEREFAQLYQLACLSISPLAKWEKLQVLERTLVAEQSQNEVSWLILRGESLVAALRRFDAKELSQELDTEKLDYVSQALLNGLVNLILWNHQWDDEYTARLRLTEAKERLEQLKIRGLVNLEGWVYATEGLLQYRQAYYRAPLEFYGRSQLSAVGNQFDQRVGNREQGRALRFLEEGERTLIQAWERLRKPSEVANHSYVQPSTLLTQLGTVRLWLGEWWMWNRKSPLDAGLPEALSYLKKALEDFENSGDDYRKVEVSVSLLTARYVAGETTLEGVLEVEQLVQSDPQSKAKYLSLLGRLRLTQGNHLFSSLVEDSADHESVGGDKKRLRKMLRYYVEACDYLARTGLEENFHLAVRVLLERISMIKNHAILEELQQGLLGIWFDYPSLEAKDMELRMVQEFIGIRQDLLGEKGGK